MSAIHWRTEWNNYLQDIGKICTWQENLAGPAHRGSWIAVVICEYSESPMTVLTYLSTQWIVEKLEEEKLLPRGMPKT